MEAILIFAWIFAGAAGILAVWCFIDVMVTMPPENQSSDARFSLVVCIVLSVVLFNIHEVNTGPESAAKVQEMNQALEKMGPR